MVDIDWEEFKFFKQYTKHPGDNFEILLDFLVRHYRMVSPKEMFETMANDDIAMLMLEKRELDSLEALEKYLYKNFNAAKS